MLCCFILLFSSFLRYDIIICLRTIITLIIIYFFLLMSKRKYSPSKHIKIEGENKQNIVCCILLLLAIIFQPIIVIPEQTPKWLWIVIDIVTIFIFTDLSNKRIGHSVVCYIKKRNAPHPYIGPTILSLGNRHMGIYILVESFSKFDYSVVIDGWGITQITIPDCVKTIGWLSDNIQSVKSVTIPESVTEIEERAFEKCIELKEILCESTKPPKGGANMFSYYDRQHHKYLPIGCKICVPEESVNEYKSAEFWKDYNDYIVGHDYKY